MKQVLIPAAFNPSAGTVDFSNVPGFVPTRLLAIVNSSARAVLYDPTSAGLGIASITGSAIKLQADVSAHGASDRVIAFYDDGQTMATAARQPALHADGGSLAHVANFPSTQTVSGSVTANDGGAPITGASLPTGGSGVTGWLSAIWSKLSGTLAVSWSGQSVASTQSGAWSVAVSNLPATQAISATSLPLPIGAATAANQPALHADGGSLAHVANFPATQAVSWSGQTVGVSSLPSLPAGSNTIGSVNVANFPALQSVSDVQNAPFSGAVAMTVGTVYAAQRSLGVLCAASGNVQMLLSDGSGLTLPVTPGWQTFPFAVIQVVAAGTTATASYFNLK
ncbi:hypothetical protein SAMN06265338_101721 [Rhodoblastus acidophilus]|uniref:Uncharacterized protein n=1 Tax=Rhodoblastus acidophilus TaxID=1074 RepID=A0A212QKY2_RHOAC|nr:hypothetical protein [Rhodoblastus acidophilus]PPQ39877.1 hypothetical protein CKO16_03480 [Rhodoblastus acidophilus]RAI17085.1 hypothetical protein CH337_18025 [Rhodoblastus acidophilus]SNB60050.1 hypothetical protein SAMN06265338_101721 [Rhodoblastus acidophilus]